MTDTETDSLTSSMLEDAATPEEEVVPMTWRDRIARIREDLEALEAELDKEHEAPTGEEEEVTPPPPFVPPPTRKPMGRGGRGRRW